MTAKERQQKRRDIARANGYRVRPLPKDEPWAGDQLPEPLDEQAHRATLALRGIAPQEKPA